VKKGLEKLEIKKKFHLLKFLGKKDLASGSGIQNPEYGSALR